MISRSQQDWFLQEVLRERLFHTLSWLLVVAGDLGVPWLVDSSLQSLPLFPYASLPCVWYVSVFSSYIDTSGWGIANNNLVKLHLKFS